MFLFHVSSEPSSQTHANSSDYFTFLHFDFTMRLLLPALPLLLLQLVEGSTYTCTYTSTNTLKAGLVQRPFVVLRGGARAAVAIDDDSDDEEIDLDDEDETELDPKLTKAAMKSTTKSQSKRAAATKQAVSSKLKTKTYKKKQGGLLKALKVPYIIRACMNPFTVFAMTRAYFASLFNLNYLKEVRSWLS